MVSTTTENHKISTVPVIKWQVTGNEFIKRNEAHLWNGEGIPGLRYLHSLGLNDETLRKYHVGYHPKEEFGSLENWGLPGEFNRNGNPKKVWLPRGIVVPCYVGDLLQSIKIRRYLTQEQKSQGEQSDSFVKGSTFGLFGVENLGDVRQAAFTDDEFDAMVLDQEAGDLIGVASFGKAAKSVGAPIWASWGRYLMPIAHILVPYAHDEDATVINDSLPLYSLRVSRAYLPNIPGVKTLTDLRKAGVDLRDWLIQSLHDMDFDPNKTTDVSDYSLTDVADGSHSINDIAATMIPDQNLDKKSAYEMFPTYKLVTYRFDEPWIVDPKIMPATPCYCCRNDEYRQRSDGGWVCNICYPPVESTK